VALFLDLDLGLFYFYFYFFVSFFSAIILLLNYRKGKACLPGASNLMAFLGLGMTWKSC
jgi:hypothetical protein